MTASHICADCKYFKTSFTVPRGSEPKEIIFDCQQGHAPIAWFSGAGCKDYQPNQSEKMEQ
mgnify:FL=1